MGLTPFALRQGTGSSAQGCLMVSKAVLRPGLVPPTGVRQVNDFPPYHQSEEEKNKLGGDPKPPGSEHGKPLSSSLLGADPRTVGRGL